MIIEIQISIYFKSLITAIQSLDLPKTWELLEILGDQILEAKEAPETLAEIKEARQAYQKGGYQSI